MKKSSLDLAIDELEHQREVVDAALEALKKLKPAKKSKLRRVPRDDEAAS